MLKKRDFEMKFNLNAKIKKPETEYKFVLNSIRSLKVKKKTQTIGMYILLSRKYLLEKKYKLALRMIKKAQMIDPRNPEMLWVYARCLEENDQNKNAIGVYKNLLKRGEAKLLKEYPWLRKKWILSLLNDCRLNIAMCYYVLLKDKLAARWFELHLKKRRRGIVSYLTIKQISKYYTSNEGCKDRVT
jgi:tetratricopeptide (TPR) repeat protein